MTKHFLYTGLTVLSYGYKTTRDLRWYVARRLQHP